jgi:hypothetical protein
VASNTGSGFTPRVAFVPRSQLPPDGTITANDALVSFSIGTSLGLTVDNMNVNFMPIAVNHICLLNFNVGSAHTFTITCVLSDIAANEMPPLTADSGVWATYNGLSNDPT